MNVRQNFQKDIFKLKGLQTPLFTRMKWKGEQWESSEILKDITYLEIIQIALAVMWWGNLLHEKKINFHVANMAVVCILNSRTSKSEKIFKKIFSNLKVFKHLYLPE
jgi:hypothetical protein